MLRDGRRVWVGAIGETNPKALVHHIVGRDLADVFVRPSSTSAAPVTRSRVAAAVLNSRSASTESGRSAAACCSR